MHRVRQSLPYFEAAGWKPTVLAVDPNQCDAPLDALLSETVPSGIQVLRVPAASRARMRRIGVGGLDLRALPYVARAGSRLLKETRFDVVYFSTTVFSLMALGPYWQRRFGVPFVLDLQDPWLSDYYDRPGAPVPPGGRFKYGLSRSLSRILEPFTMRRANHVISVSPAYPEMLRSRYPSMPREMFTVLPFGAPEADFELLRRQPVRQTVFDPDDGLEHWVYVGRAGGDLAFTLTAFFTALRDARRVAPERFARVRLHFVGTDYAAGDRARKTVEPVARVCDVGELVEERPHRIPYFEALQCLLDASALIMPGSDDPGYTASKLFPCILARKPLLAVFHEASSVNDVLRSTQAGISVPFRSGDSADSVARRIHDAWFAPQAWREPPRTDWEAFEPYTAGEMTRRQCEVFDRLVASGVER